MLRALRAGGFESVKLVISRDYYVHWHGAMPALSPLLRAVRCPLPAAVPLRPLPAPGARCSEHDYEIALVPYLHVRGKDANAKASAADGGPVLPKRPQPMDVTIMTFGTSIAVQNDLDTVDRRRVRALLVDEAEHRAGVAEAAHAVAECAAFCSRIARLEGERYKHVLGRRRRTVVRGRHLDAPDAALAAFIQAGTFADAPPLQL